MLAVYITMHLHALTQNRSTSCLCVMPRAAAQRSHPATTVAEIASGTIRPILWRILLRCLTSFVRCYNVEVLHAGVAELVDAPDSKSGGAKAPCRFEPDLRHQEVPANKH